LQLPIIIDKQRPRDHRCGNFFFAAETIVLAKSSRTTKTTLSLLTRVFQAIAVKSLASSSQDVVGRNRLAGY
jgi:hypothetical protein